MKERFASSQYAFGIGLKKENQIRVYKKKHCKLCYDDILTVEVIYS
jgi:hypothetical protein